MNELSRREIPNANIKFQVSLVAEKASGCSLNAIITGYLYQFPTARWQDRHHTPEKKGTEVESYGIERKKDASLRVM